MGEVYRDVGEEPVRLEMREGNEFKGICQAIVVNAKRGKHLAVPYGPVTKAESGKWKVESDALIGTLKKIAVENNCSFIRLSPFWPSDNSPKIEGAVPSPLHLLAEHIWYLDLKGASEESIFKNMRATHRNLIRRSEREGVEVIASNDPLNDINEFFRLYDETRKRHHFVPYPSELILSQVKRFSERNECTLYLAKYQGEVIASSVHMHFGGETSYHHGASSDKYPKIPASYALQWKAIKDALKRSDRMFNFWGISPPSANATGSKPEGAIKHPFAGVRTFKTGFGGELLELTHCRDIPISKKYYVTRAIETVRKWRRGF